MEPHISPPSRVILGAQLGSVSRWLSQISLDGPLLSRYTPECNETVIRTDDRPNRFSRSSTPIFSRQSHSPFTLFILFQNSSKTSEICVLSFQSLTSSFFALFRS